MIKQEINEIKRLYTPSRCSITRICGCYVDGEKNKKTDFKEAFLSLPEEEIFKYFELLRKTLSGTVGKNMLNLEFPLDSEKQGGTQEFLFRLRESKLKDDTLLDEFYDKVIASYEYVGNYLILLIHDAYDVPGQTGDGLTLDDASDTVYEYILCCICPVNLSKPGLSYDAQTNEFHNRIRDWIVEMPEAGFLFPSFNDRCSDIHSTLYYTKKPEEPHSEFVDSVLGAVLPLTAGSQRETFQALVEETLGEDAEYEVVKNIHENLTELIEEHKEIPEPLALDKHQVRDLFEKSGVEEEKLTSFDQLYDNAAGENACLLADNVANTRTFEVKTPDVIVKVTPGRADLVNTMTLHGKQCLVIELSEHVEVNGIVLKKHAPII
ncbi:DUF4317 domain-containing protein [Parablautia intestinalis]|jgi:hypothetical protein|uniref:DUF4317 domain-containing protein n=1 Tax=Parablautia intestinalis TaxID=2320100 RepID=A0A3A9B086_9FIRM|nr:DUF4317 domain-containing protein [Parablautia intestinalis]MCI8616352.1 DUF4317 domain-containing protein [Lachnospiraceae bacterium]RKI92836.1 DUF4317 domain-containing protein [Parablautia intestinalis]